MGRINFPKLKSFIMFELLFPRGSKKPRLNTKEEKVSFSKNKMLFFSKSKAIKFARKEVKAGRLKKIIIKRKIMKPYRLGETWKVSFDIRGMYRFGETAKVSWGVSNLTKLAKSIKSVAALQRRFKVRIPLSGTFLLRAISKLKAGKIKLAKEDMRTFNARSRNVGLQ